MSIWVVQEVMSHRIGTAYICTGLVRYSTVVYAAAGKKHTLAMSRGEISCTRCSVELVIQVRMTLGTVFGVVGRAWIPVETELAL